jgi:hypothetical protein
MLLVALWLLDQHTHCPNIINMSCSKLTLSLQTTNIVTKAVLGMQG